MPGPNAFAQQSQQSQQQRDGIGDASSSKEIKTLATSTVHPDGNAFAKNPEMRRSAEERMKKELLRSSGKTTVTQLIYEGSSSSGKSAEAAGDKEQQKEVFRLVPADGLRSQPTSRQYFENKREQSLTKMFKDGPPSPHTVRSPYSSNGDLTARPVASANVRGKQANNNPLKSPKRKFLDRVGITVTNLKTSFSSTNSPVEPPTPTIVPPKAAQFLGTSPSTRSNSVKRTPTRHPDTFATAPARSTMLNSNLDKPAGPEAYEANESWDSRDRTKAVPSHHSLARSMTQVVKKSDEAFSLPEAAMGSSTPPSKQQGVRFRSNSAPPTPPAKNTPPQMKSIISEVSAGKSSLRPMSDIVEASENRQSKTAEDESSDAVQSAGHLRKGQATLVTEGPRVQSTYVVVEQVVAKTPSATREQSQSTTTNRKVLPAKLLPGGLLPPTVYSPSVYQDTWGSENESAPPMPDLSQIRPTSASNRSSEAGSNETSVSVTFCQADELDALNEVDRARLLASHNLPPSFGTARNTESRQAKATMGGGPVSESTVTPQSATFPAHPSAMPTPLQPSNSDNGDHPDNRRLLHGLLALHDRVDHATGLITASIDLRQRDTANSLSDKHEETLKVLEAYIADTRSHCYESDHNMGRLADKTRSLTAKFERMTDAIRANHKAVNEMITEDHKAFGQMFTEAVGHIMQKQEENTAAIMQKQEENSAELGELKRAITTLTNRLNSRHAGSSPTSRAHQATPVVSPMHPIFAYSPHGHGMVFPMTAFGTPTHSGSEQIVSYGSPRPHQHHRNQQQRRGRRSYPAGTGQQFGELNLMDDFAYNAHEEEHDDGSSF